MILIVVCYCFLAQSTSNDHPSGGNGGDVFPPPSNFSTENPTIIGKTRRDKLANKNQQDEEEERGLTKQKQQKNLIDYFISKFRNDQSLRWKCHVS